LLNGFTELGVLLQVERELPQFIRQVYVGKGTGLFAEQEQSNWVQAEARLRTALNEFAQAAKSTYQGRLFAQDALQGLRVIDLCRMPFDVVVMNPPFGDPSSASKPYMKSRYSNSNKNIFAAFVERGLQLLRPQGHLGAITSRTGLFLSSFAKWREHVLLEKSFPLVVVDLGDGVLDDANVRVAAYVLQGVAS
jgi:type I restriction-modification system DNA methylase subunit